MCSVTVHRWVRASALPVILAALAMGGCGGRYVTRGAALYDDGRYVEAAEVFERTEQRLAKSPNDERARFGLYRGATFLKLGDAVHAARWLGYARSVVKSDPDALDSDELALLEASLKALASAKPAEPQSKSDAEVATAPTP
jgi:tetratricopeptide (TPR) repeat protein